jgi:hypothetical protein
VNIALHTQEGKLPLSSRSEIFMVINAISADVTSAVSAKLHGVTFQKAAHCLTGHMARVESRNFEYSAELPLRFAVWLQ